MKKLIFMLFLLISVLGCDQIKDKTTEKKENLTEIKESLPEIKENLMKVSFIAQNKKGMVLVAYTNDNDSLWLDNDWNKSIYSQMKGLSKSFSTILLFDSEKHTPNVKEEGMNYSQSYDKYMVCGFWSYSNGGHKYCSGGVKKDGNFKKCKEF